MGEFEATSFWRRKNVGLIWFTKSCETPEQWANYIIFQSPS